MPAIRRLILRDIGVTVKKCILRVSARLTRSVYLVQANRHMEQLDLDADVHHQCDEARPNQDVVQAAEPEY